MGTTNRTKKRLIEAADICHLRLINSVAISPDEKSIAYTVETISQDNRKYFSRIHVVDCDSGESRPFTFGEVNDREMVWSPDGKDIAFISTREGKAGVYIISSEGGEARKVIEEDGTFANPVWTPDGRELVYQFRYNDSHTEKDEAKKKEAPLYRHITRVYYREDGVGFLPKDRFHIWKVTIANGRTTQLTRGRYDDIQPAVSPNGKWIAFVSNRSKDPDFDYLRVDLFVMPTSGGKARRIPTPAGLVARPVFSPDGRKIAYFGHTNPDDRVLRTNYHVWVVGVSGKPAARDLIPGFDRSIMCLTATDTGVGARLFPPSWSPDGRRLYFRAVDTGNTHLFYVSASGGSPKRITRKQCHVKDYSLNGRMKRIAVLVADLTTPGELHVMPAAGNGDSKARVLVAPNEEFFGGIALPRVKEVWFESDDGTRLQGWLASPPALAKRRLYPAILAIHGGPPVQYGFTFFFEMLLWASKGYVVLYTNPRGSAGRGGAFANAIGTDWGAEVAYRDCLAAADYLAKLPFVDEKRMGVTGGSYGGYMTNWIIGHIDRFKAAVALRSLADLMSYTGSSDWGWNVHRQLGGFFWTNRENYEQCSPLTYAKNIKTPLLIIHSENDLRVSIQQAEQLFTTLKLMKKKVELVRFPEESHGLSRHGRPDRRIARLEWIAKWFDRYLK
ncbi:MAG TPA: S9 family peptidase [Acidobacteriota bacterium]|nr:S9 family peptidase [Acidobacteriota bacterium]